MSDCTHSDITREVLCRECWTFLDCEEEPPYIALRSQLAAERETREKVLCEQMDVDAAYWKPQVAAAEARAEKAERERDEAVCSVPFVYDAATMDVVCRIGAFRVPEAKNVVEIVRGLADQRDAAEARAEGNNALLAAEIERARTAEARVAKLTEALREYGDHLPSCESETYRTRPCNCGWKEAAAALEGEEK